MKSNVLNGFTEIVEMLDKGPLPKIYNAIFYTVHGKYVTNKYGYIKAETSQLSTKIWSMVCVGKLY